MRQRMGMYTVTMETPGRRHPTRNQLRHPNILLLNPLWTNLHHPIHLHNRQPIKVKTADHIPNPVAEQPPPVKCPVLPVIAQEVMQVQAHGVEAEEPVAVAAAGVVEAVVVSAVAEEVVALAAAAEGNFSVELFNG